MLRKPLLSALAFARCVFVLHGKPYPHKIRLFILRMTNFFWCYVGVIPFFNNFVLNQLKITQK